jgi:hypothetical protein
MKRHLVPLLLLVAGLALTGCRVTSQDDETAPPTPPTTSSSPAQPAQALPATVPVGHGDVGPDDVVWAQSGTLHVGTQQWDLSPLRVESFVVVPGGVFFLSDAELWFTDLVRARATGVTAATRLVSTAQGSTVRVTAGNPSATHAWDTTTGRSVPVQGEPEPPVAGRRGPGSFGLLGTDGDPLRVHRTGSQRPVRLRGVVGDGFRLVRWPSGTTFYGLALDKGRPSVVLGCDLATRTCTASGRVAQDHPVVFESGG